MRIVGGKYKGRRITPPYGLKARPTTDFAKEALFNILANRIDFESVTVLDLFSGTGSISFEFASRGAEMVHLVEKESKQISAIRSVINHIGIPNIITFHADTRVFLKACDYMYDIVFADPPYDLPWLKELPGMVLSSGVLKDNGFFILEHPKKMSFGDQEGFFEHRSYGSVNFSFFAKK